MVFQSSSDFFGAEFLRQCNLLDYPPISNGPSYLFPICFKQPVVQLNVERSVTPAPLKNLRIRDVLANFKAKKEGGWDMVGWEVAIWSPER